MYLSCLKISTVVFYGGVKDCAAVFGGAEIEGDVLNPLVLL